MMAKIDWTFNKQDNMIKGTKKIDQDKSISFAFRLERYKDSVTYEDSLKVFSLIDDENNGFIETTIYDLGKDIKQLKKYGVVLSSIEFGDLQQKIEDNYLDLNIVPVSFAKDPRFGELIAEVRKYVNDNPDYITNDFCYVPVDNFNKLAESCEFYEYELKKLRGYLNAQGYIRTAQNRYSTTVRINKDKDKVVRVIAFKRDKLGIEKPVVKKDKQSKKSGADE